MLGIYSLRIGASKRTTFLQHHPPFPKRYRSDILQQTGSTLASTIPQIWPRRYHNNQMRLRPNPTHVASSSLSKVGHHTVHGKATLTAPLANAQIVCPGTAVSVQMLVNNPSFPPETFIVVLDGDEQDGYRVVWTAWKGRIGAMGGMAKAWELHMYVVSWLAKMNVGHSRQGAKGCELTEERVSRRTGLLNESDIV